MYWGKEQITERYCWKCNKYYRGTANHQVHDSDKEPVSKKSESADISERRSQTAFKFDKIILFNILQVEVFNAEARTYTASMASSCTLLIYWCYFYPYGAWSDHAENDLPDLDGGYFLCCMFCY